MFLGLLGLNLKFFLYRIQHFFRISSSSPARLDNESFVLISAITVLKRLACFAMCEGSTFSSPQSAQFPFALSKIQASRNADQEMCLLSFALSFFFFIMSTYCKSTNLFSLPIIYLFRLSHSSAGSPHSWVQYSYGGRSSQSKNLS